MTGLAHPTPARGAKLTVSLGLVNVGVKYAPLVRNERTSGKYVDPVDKGPVAQQYVNAKGEVVKPVTAYESDAGLVVLNPEDVKALESERDARLELKAFCDPMAVDSLYVEKTFLVWPEKGQEAGYDLICEALAEEGKVLIGTTVIRKSTKAIMLRYGQGCLLAHQCTYDANVAWNDHRLVTMAKAERPTPAREMLDTAVMLFSNLPDEFDFAQVSDEYDERLRAAIVAASKGLPVEPAPQAEPAPVVDLMEALKASVAAAKEAKPKPRKAAAKPKAAARTKKAAA